MADPKPTPQIPEIQVGPADLIEWLKEPTQVWLPLSPAVASTTWKEMKSAKSVGVYQREGGGLVALTIPRAVRLDTLRGDFRRFSVASDLLVGAARDGNGGMILFGRERAAPLAILPPLRFETFASFALNRADEVMQSYERKRIFAGRVQEGELADWDWAPILLSQHLEDAEFGTLLNLADQILKSWSEHGQISYYAFNYPRPATYPFGDKAATKVFFDKLLSMSPIFNWNTKFFATQTELGSLKTITADRTGALQVLYIPGNLLLPFGNSEEFAELKAAEARDYFGQPGDPILVRVAQNVLLYQSVQSLLKVSDPELPKKLSRSDLVVLTLQKEAAKWISKLTDASSAEQFDAEARQARSRFSKQARANPAKAR